MFLAVFTFVRSDKNDLFLFVKCNYLDANFQFEFFLFLNDSNMY